MKANNTVGEQITVEQLIEKHKVMTISKAMIMMKTPYFYPRWQQYNMCLATPTLSLGEITQD